ncbi:RdRP-domain-containing protein [Schizopora paradoxa]|uniref:RNA-dependent RNA polymerase n=1 Tax=Schizopora paradoxa TaxID=27342 RepID=A0A0H2RLI8_9AGAM|nr:RdRP-domain-containing protein [Schizopora paradoxa]
MPPVLPKPRVPFLFMKLQWDERTQKSDLGPPMEQMQPSCRAIRIVASKSHDSREEDCSKRFLIIAIPFKMPKDAVRNWLQTAVNKGVYTKELGHTFKSLGCTESGIKIGQWIFFREDKHCTVATLLAEFGDISQVFRASGPGKYSARLKLSFSSSVPSIDISDAQVLEVSDLKARDGTLTADGCGAIRETCAKRIRKVLRLPSHTSVFHFRRGGLKGLLVAYPDNLFEKKICNSQSSQVMIAYRPSMLKYKGGPVMLDIQNVPDRHPPAARLNYFFIVQLLSLGVKLNPLKRLLESTLEAIKSISSNRRHALRYIDGTLDAKADGFQQDVFEMLQAGHAMSEPTVKASLKRIQQSQYISLREKLTILIPKSCYVYGVVDELGVLKDDEVFINLCERSGIIESKVFVTRNPCYKPSDIRILKAVNCVELAFHSNSIVFPRNGPFSIPNSMAGGDLDGDTFFVCWDQTIMPPTEVKPTLAMASTNTGKKKASREWDVSKLDERLIEVFVLLRGDRLLARASNEWKNVVEKVPGLAKGEYPLALAEIVEVALDLTKTGDDFYEFRAKFDSLQKKYGKDVNENARPPTDELRAMVPSEDKHAFMPPPVYPIDQDIVKFSEVPELQREWAKHYDEGKKIMREFNLALAESIKVDKDLAELGDKRSQRRNIENGSGSSRQVEEIKRKFMDTWFPASSWFMDEEYKQGHLRASAWYKVGYEAGKPAFAWLGARYLNNIKSFTTNNNKPGLAIGALLNLDDSASVLSLAVSRSKDESKIESRTVSMTKSKSRTTTVKDASTKTSSRARSKDTTY